MNEIPGIDEYLIHTTSQLHAQDIAERGLTPISYWAISGEVSEYYAETVMDEGEVPMEIRLPLSVLINYNPEPDHPGLEEPLTYTLGRREEDIWEDWEATTKTWQDCLVLIQSMRCRSAIPASVVKKYNPHLVPIDSTNPRARGGPR